MNRRFFIIGPARSKMDLSKATQIIFLALSRPVRAQQNNGIQARLPDSSSTLIYKNVNSNRGLVVSVFVSRPQGGRFDSRKSKKLRKLKMRLTKVAVA